MNPYLDKKLNNKGFIRTFSKDALIEELVWHRDRNDRTVNVIDGDGWEIQFDNDLPRPLMIGEELNIPAHTFHRIKRGKTDLILKIEETNGIL